MDIALFFLLFGMLYFSLRSDTTIFLNIAGFLYSLYLIIYEFTGSVILVGFGIMTLVHYINVTIHPVK